jgi:hypothetical protein
MAYFIFLKYLDSLEDFTKIHMSKSLSNLLVQILKVCQKSKFQIKFEKVLFLKLGPTPVFSQAAPTSFSSTGSLSLSPLGLGLSVGLACPLGPAGRESVAPCPLAASFVGKRLTSRRLRPSPCPADTWAPPGHLPPWADHRCHHLTCARATSRHRFHSHNDQSTPPPHHSPPPPRSIPFQNGHPHHHYGAPPPPTVPL